MAKLNYDNDDLLENVKMRMMIPVDQVSYSDGNILTLASAEVDMEMMPDIMRAREEFYVYSVTLPMNNSGRYPIPSRAVGQKVREVFLKSSDSDQPNYAPCVRVAPEDLPYFQSYNQAVPYGGYFYVQGNYLVFPQPINNSFPANFIEIHFYMRPNELCEVSAALKITDIDYDTGTINVEERQVPSTFAAGSIIDFIQFRPGNRLVGYDVEMTGVSSNSNINSQKYIVVDPASIPDDLEVGDWIAIEMQTPVPMIPADLRPMLEQATVCRVLEGQGDLDNLKAAQNKLEIYRKRMYNLIEDRTEGEVKKVTSKTGLIKSSLIGGFYRRYKGY